MHLRLLLACCLFIVCIGCEANDDLPPYDRSLFGNGWPDKDGDCQNMRHELLERFSTIPVRYKEEDACKVETGKWISPFTGEVIYAAKLIDIDHVVPLKWAWDHGAYQWSVAMRKDFNYDDKNLLVVESRLNSQKGAKGIDKWLPSENQCEYIVRFIRVMKTYRLELNSSENKHFQQVKDKYCSK